MSAPSAAAGRADAYGALAAADPVLAGLMRDHGTSDPFAWIDAGRTGGSNFAAMVLHILGQQISVAVAFILYDRLANAAGGIPTPQAVLALDPDTLRGFGLSRAKAAYVHDLASRAEDGRLDIEHMDGLSDGQAFTALTAVRGIGPWSAEMFLIHQLHRADILPAGDVGIRRAIEQAWQLPGMPTIDEVRDRGAAWAPHRTYASALLWRSLAHPASTAP